MHLQFSVFSSGLHRIFVSLNLPRTPHLHLEYRMHTFVVYCFLLQLPTFSEANIYGMFPQNLLQVKERTRSTRSHHLQTRKPELPRPLNLTFQSIDHETKKSPAKYPEPRTNIPNQPPSCKIIKNEDFTFKLSNPIEFYLSIFGTDRSSVVLRDTVGYFAAENFMNKLVNCDCADRSLLHLRGHDGTVYALNLHGEKKKFTVQKKSYRTVIKTLRKCLYFEFRAMGLNNEFLSKLMGNARHCNVYQHVDGLTDKSYFPMGVMDDVH